MSSVAVAAEALPPGPLKYQTWLLKVPIHCEGCKRKVKKVLHNIDGVFMTTIDSQEHKVVVVGDVDLDTLIKKLIKSGKQAEVWPELIENCKQEQNDNNRGVNEGDELSEVDEMGGEVKTIISTGGGTATAGEEPNGGKKKKKKKKKKNKGDGALAPAMSILNPESAAPAPGSADLVSQPYEDLRSYQVIDYLPREHGTIYGNPISSNMYQPPVNSYAYWGWEMQHIRPPLQSDPIRNYEDDYYQDDDDDYNVGCSVM